MLMLLLIARSYLLLFFYGSSISVQVSGSASTINIGGLFDEGTDYKAAFEFALQTINEEAIYNVILNPRSQEIQPNDDFESSQASCLLLESGVLGIFGPSSEDGIDSVQSVCDSKEIPHIISKWSTRDLRGSTIVNLHPHPAIVAKAYIEVIQAWGWSKFIILYEDDDSFVRIGHLMEYAEELNFYYVLRQLDKFNTGLFRPMLRDIRTSGINNIVIDCHYENLAKFLREAQQIGMMTEEFSFFFTNLDLHTLDLNDYRYSSVKLSGLRLVTPESQLVESISSKLLGKGDEMEDMLDPPSWKLKSDVALLIDGINMYTSVLNELDVFASENIKKTRDLRCNSTESWENGLSAVNLMRTSTYNGLTGHISFNSEGLRTDFQLDVIELMAGGVVEVGKWNSSAIPSLKIMIERTDEEKDDPSSLKNKTFVVILSLVEPHAMWKWSPENLKGNDRFEGFGVELIEMLAEMEGFNYKFIVREDSDNGGKRPDGSWGGMIGDVINHKADLAIADLTMTSEREEGVDFSEPFMNLGVSILFQKPQETPPSFFSFADPFSLDTWGSLFFVLILVSVSMFILARISHDEWLNPEPCNQDPPFLRNIYNMKNSFWFITASLLQQGVDIAPTGASTRILTVNWMFFVLITVSSYTASLAAFLQRQNTVTLFNNLGELVENYEKYDITFGAKKGGATYKFFNNSQNPTYKKVFDYMTSHPENMPDKNILGVERAEKERYAFFMESTSIEYETERHCDVTKVGEVLDPNKAYGIAMRKNSPYRKRISLAILQLQSSGRLGILKNKWWKEKRGGGKCQGAGEEEAAEPLYLSNVNGVFFVTIYGMLLAIFFAFTEWLVAIFKLAKKRKLTFREAFMEELRFLISFELLKPMEYLPVSQSRAASKAKAQIDSIKRSKSRSQSKSRSITASSARSRPQSHFENENGTKKNSRNSRESGSYIGNSRAKLTDNIELE